MDEPLAHTLNIQRYLYLKCSRKRGIVRIKSFHLTCHKLKAETMYYLQAQRQIMNSGSECPDFSIRQDTRLVCIYFIKDSRNIQGLDCTHEIIKIREGKLHVLRVAHLVK